MGFAFFADKQLRCLGSELPMSAMRQVLGVSDRCLRHSLALAISSSTSPP
jgi:hypothetical protein